MHRSDPSPDVIRRQYEVLQEALTWDVMEVSRRVLVIDQEVVSGHNGEWLGSLMGAWGAFLRLGDMARAAEVEAIVDEELAREARLFEKLARSRPSPQADTILLKLAAVLTHNVGDVDQGYKYCAPLKFLYLQLVNFAYFSALHSTEYPISSHLSMSNYCSQQAELLAGE